MRALPKVTAVSAAGDEAVFQVLSNLDAHHCWALAEEDSSGPRATLFDFVPDLEG